MADNPDRWYRWLRDVRFGGDDVCREKDLREVLYPVRDTVLDKAHLQPGDTVLDVGTGDGLLACGALERLGPSGQVVEFTEHLRPLGESGTGRLRRALAYLTAVKE
jgi:hypothetical protein